MKEGLCRKCVGRVVFFEGGEGDMQNASNHRCRWYPRVPVVRKKQVFWEFALTLRDDSCGEWEPAHRKREAQ